MAVIKRAHGSGFTTDSYQILVEIQQDLVALKAAFDAHVHGGVTTGGGNTSAVGAAPVLKTQLHKTD